MFHASLAGPGAPTKAKYRRLIGPDADFIPASAASVSLMVTAIRFERIDVSAPELVKTLSQPEQMARLLADGPQTVAFIVEELGIAASSIRTHISRNPGRFTKTPDNKVRLTQ